MGVVFLALAFADCSRHQVSEPIRKLAVLRFENLSGDTSLDWVGRALSESLTKQLGALPQAAINQEEPAFAAHLTLAPGVSATRESALRLGATDFVSGYYSTSHGQFTITAVNRNFSTQKSTQSFTTTGDLVGSLREIAKTFESTPQPLPTEKEAALREYAKALDTAGSSAEAHFQQASLADGSFGDNYLAWINWAAANHDPAAMNRALEAANLHRDALKPVDRDYLDLQTATLHQDQGGRIKALTAIVHQKPNDAVLLRTLAEAELSVHQAQAAASHYTQAATLEPQNADGWNLLAYARMYAGEFAEAKKAIAQYQKLRPNDPNTVDSEGDIDFFFGHFADAEKHYLNSVRLNPDFNNGVDQWKAARARLMTGDVPGATALFSTFLASRTKAGDPTVTFRDAEWQYLTGHQAEGRRKMEEAANSAATAPLRALCKTQAAVWEAVAGNSREAAQLAEQAMQLRTKETLFTAAIVRFVSEPSTTPTEWQNRAAKTFGGAGASAIQRIALAFAYTFSHQWSEAVAAWKPLYETSTPADQTAAFLYGGSLQESGQTAEATPLLKFNPVPAPAPTASFESLYFPALLRWRGDGETFRKLAPKN